jgi:UDP-N-acetylmuramoyl-L-alanyl-D-glutamate--2,6-diaminopimelate ligase
MNLSALLQTVGECHVTGHREREIAGLAYDSREVRPGFVFVALRGHALDGHKFIRSALKNGAVGVVAEDVKGVDADVTLVRVPDSREALSRMAVTFYRRPFEAMDVVGITGTNGKTTTSYLMESILLAAGAKSGVIGTINYRFGGTIRPAPVTTPESLDLMRVLREMADGGVTHVVMEVSSHALDQQRTRGCPFRIAVFTNLSRDHLDYHGTMEAYFEAKSRLFRGLAREVAGHPAAAVINRDDPRGGDLVGLTRAETVTYGLAADCLVRAVGVRADREGISATLMTHRGPIPVRSSLIGRFNVYNIMAAASAALCLGIDPGTIAEGVARLPGVPGRLQRLETGNGPAVVVDYAHTPDALLKALEAVKPLSGGRLMTVFGCGGDRDPGKRAEMGRAAAELSDLLIITSDNPRTEDPGAIIAEIEKGVRETGLERLGSPPSQGSGASGYWVTPDRAEAIRTAVSAAVAGDLVLIAGKGHEDYQLIGNEKRHFDDREVAAAAAAGGPA